MKGLDDYLCVHSINEFLMLPSYEVAAEEVRHEKWDFENVESWLMDEPPKQEWIFTDLIPKGIVGVITALGGTGKTFMLLYIILAAITGKLFFKCFNPVKPLKVLALLGEDPPNEIWRRFKSIQKSAGIEIKENDLKNLKLLCGKSRPLMELRNGNPTVTKKYEWLKETVEEFKPDLIVIDPKSQWYGLEENNNDHNTQWVNCLKELAALNGATILFSHHVSKSNSNKLEQSASRGGSALTDACRWVANMRRMDEVTAKKYEIDDHWRYIEFSTSKNSYAPTLPGTLVFKFEEGGSLSQVELETRRVAKIAVAIRDVLENFQGNLSKRDIIKEKTGKDFREKISTMFTGKITLTDLSQGLEYGLSKEYFCEKDVQIGQTKQSKKVISPINNVF